MWYKVLKNHSYQLSCMEPELNAIYPNVYRIFDTLEVIDTSILKTFITEIYDQICYGSKDSC